MLAFHEMLLLFWSIKWQYDLPDSRARLLLKSCFFPSNNPKLFSLQWAHIEKSWNQTMFGIYAWQENQIKSIIILLIQLTWTTAAFRKSVIEKFEPELVSRPWCHCLLVHWWIAHFFYEIISSSCLNRAFFPPLISLHVFFCHEYYCNGFAPIIWSPLICQAIFPHI